MFLEKIDTIKVSYVTSSLRYTQSKITMTNKCAKNKSHATHLGISARLTAVALTKISDVSTVTKTIVESSMM